MSLPGAEEVRAGLTMEGHQQERPVAEVPQTPTQESSDLATTVLVAAAQTAAAAAAALEQPVALEMSDTEERVALGFPIASRVPL